MVIDKKILDELTAKAKENPRLRQSLDMRNSEDDQSQRMLNAFEEYFYDDQGNLTDTIDMVPGGTVLNIEKGQWHSLKCLESGTILFEAKDGPYQSLSPEDIMEV